MNELIKLIISVIVAAFTLTVTIRKKEAECPT